MVTLDTALTGKIKEAVMQFDPEAEVSIFGSRARGEASTDSDWDVMIVTKQAVTTQFKCSIRHALYEIEWDHGCVISSIMQSRAEWGSHLMKITPFYQNVTRDAYRL